MTNKHANRCFLGSLLVCSLITFSGNTAASGACDSLGVFDSLSMPISLSYSDTAGSGSEVSASNGWQETSLETDHAEIRWNVGIGFYNVALPFKFHDECVKFSAHFDYGKHTKLMKQI